MEFTWAVLMVLGIFVGIPMVLVLSIGGVYALSGRLAERAKRAQAPAEAAELDTEVEATHTI